MTAWHPYKISQLGRVVTGKTPPSTQPELFLGEIPFLTPSDMSDDCRDVTTERFVSTDWDPKRRQLLPEGSTCVVCIGATIGKVCMVSGPSHTNQQVNSIVVDTERFDQGFVFYSMRTLGAELRARAAGAATPIINKTAFSEITIWAPPLDTQRRIASILGAYDDLIEVNRRRVAVLEEMARGLFEEWFVRFRFPGHESVPLVDTPNGPLPLGWSWGTLSDIASSTGKSITPSAQAETTFAHYSLPAFDAGRSPAMDLGDTIKSNKIVVQGPLVLVSKLNPRIPRVWLVPAGDECMQVASTEFVPVQAKGGSPLHYIFAIVSSESFRDRLVGMAGGTSTSHQRVKPKDVFATPIALAPEKLVTTAGNVLSSIYDLVGQLERANRSLAASRDVLLPRLISGQLSVEAAERDLELAA